MPYVAGQKVKVSDFGQASTCAQYNQAAGQVVGTAADTLLAFGTANITTAHVTRTVSGVGHTFTLNRSGLWAITSTLRWVPAANGERVNNISLNGLTAFIAMQSQAGSGAAASTLNCHITRAFVAGDVIRGGCYQSSGGNLSTEANNGLAWGRIDLVWLGG